MDPAAPPAREGATIHETATDKQIGHVTSGSFSPVLKRSVVMGYIETGFSSAGTSVMVKVRGKSHAASISKMPFVPTKYKKDEDIKKLLEEEKLHKKEEPKDTRRRRR